MLTSLQTIPWLRSVTKLPVVIKGIQCEEDALLAVEAGVVGILLSNYGGRQLDYALPPLEVLYRLRTRHPDVFSKVEGENYVSYRICSQILIPSSQST